MPRQIDINPEFQQALDLINRGRHLFVTGKAGAGKSTLLAYAVKNSRRNIAVVAPTGVAALNVGGQTIHRFFGFPVNITPEKISSYEFTPRAKRIYQRLQTLFIDEASMLRADIFDCIDVFLRLYGPDSQKSFGGVQIVLVGDLFQLPPVVSTPETQYFAARYAAPYFFGAQAFRGMDMEIVELNKIYRQTDADFISLLSRIRDNSATAADLAALNRRVLPAPNGVYITLTTTNKMAAELNAEHLHRLNAPTCISQAVIDGNFQAEYFPAAEVLELRAGAQIMFLNNDLKGRWVNGSLGRIEEIKTGPQKIRYLTVRLQNNAKLVDVFPYTWEIFRYTLAGSEIISEVAGSFTQFPVRLAWAVTIHKSQGQTFDQVRIDIGRGTFAAGQLYVALSRCTSLAGITLCRPLTAAHILTDSRIVRFMRRTTPLADPAPQILQNSLQEAATNRRKLEIVYQKTDGSLSRRVIIPLHIKGRLLQAFCLERQEQRSFTIERIRELRPYRE